MWSYLGKVVHCLSQKKTGFIFFLVVGGLYCMCSFIALPFLMFVSKVRAILLNLHCLSLVGLVVLNTFSDPWFNSPEKSGIFFFKKSKISFCYVLFGCGLRFRFDVLTSKGCEATFKCFSFDRVDVLENLSFPSGNESWFFSNFSLFIGRIRRVFGNKSSNNQNFSIFPITIIVLVLTGRV